MSVVTAAAVPATPVHLPYLSHSRVNRYLLCPEQYRLHYVENLRPRYTSANLVFGKVIHEALASLFQQENDPGSAFSDLWDAAKSLDLTYTKRDSWEKFQESGRLLLQRFVQDELPRIADVAACEKSFEFAVTGLDVPFIGIVDLVAQVDGKRTLVDFKTSGSAYADHEVALSDQLTAYHLADPSAERVAFCVLLKTKTPAIHWHKARRTGTQLSEYVSKVQIVAADIAAGRFYKRPGRWCSWCDFLPVCLGDQKKTEETLVRTGS